MNRTPRLMQDACTYLQMLNATRSLPVGASLRILVIIDSLGPGGAQRQLCLLARGLAARGHALRVLSLNDDTDPRNLSQISSVAEVEIIGKARLAAGLGPLALWRRLKAWQPDVVLTMLEVSDLLGRIAGRLYRRAPVVTSIRSRNLQKPAWWLLLDRLTMAWADRVVFNSSVLTAFGRENEGVTKEQACVIVNGVDLSDLVAEPTERRPLGLDEHCPVVLAVGRLARQKRFDMLLAAMARLPGAFADTQLLIAGAGPLQGPLSDEAVRLGLAERVHFLGKRDDVPSLLALADAFVLCSEYEGMPNVVMEAMGAGCPVVATRIDGNLELLPDSSYGWLVEPGDPDVLAHALEEALTDRAEAARRAQRARLRAREVFSVERMVERYAALFDELATGR